MLRNSLNASRPLRTKLRTRQHGYLLLELGLVLIISTILLAGTFSKIVDSVDQLNAESTSDYLKELQGGVNRYIEENAVALKTGNAITGFTDPMRPTITELKANKYYLDPSFGQTSALGLSFAVWLVKTPACPSGAGCVITGIAYSTTNYKDPSGNVRIDVLAKAYNSLGPDGAMSFVEAPGLLRFPGGASYGNPVNSAGVLGIRVGNGSGLSSLLSPYYRLDGSKALTGAMDANNNDIKNVNDLQVAGGVTAKNVDVTGSLTMIGVSATPGSACGPDQIVRKTPNGDSMAICAGGIWQKIGSAIPGVGEGVPCSSPGQLGSDATGISYVCNGFVWSSINTTVMPNSACTPDGRLAVSFTKEQLVCKNGSYIKLLSLLGKSVELYLRSVTDGTAVAKPTCDTGGTAAYKFLLTQTVVDVSVTPPRQAMYVTAIDNGSTWTVKIKVKDNTGAEFTANNYSVSAIMKVECVY
ncbi:hypothetical protein [Massilia aerilata]|uniref:Shufflon system plasmid conjugative transfer pilus tip adhesin PilV n=1 Tax=Massilia aerilata TaxID=453817 RepID=A0ABW0S195_9BURK